MIEARGPPSWHVRGGDVALREGELVVLLGPSVKPRQSLSRVLIFGSVRGYSSFC